MKKGGVQNVPDIAVVFEQAKLLARNMEKDATDFYKSSLNPMTACHKQVALQGRGWSSTSPLMHNNSEGHLDKA
jgi:hypothetical protein